MEKAAFNSLTDLRQADASALAVVVGAWGNRRLVVE